MDKPTTIDEYIAGFTPDVQAVLEQVRATIREAAPEAAETIKYKMPTFLLDGDLIYFAAFKHHIGFYDTPIGDEEFRQELATYRQGKGSVQFPLDKPMPLALITKMVRFRISENQAKAAAKNQPKS